MTGLGATLLSILMLAAFLLAAGGIRLIANRVDRRKGVLMLIAAVVLGGNVMIWAVPL